MCYIFEREGGYDKKRKGFKTERQKEHIEELKELGSYKEVFKSKRVKN